MLIKELVSIVIVWGLALAAVKNFKKQPNVRV